jgi:hypothetical protein
LTERETQLRLRLLEEKAGASERRAEQVVRLEENTKSLWQAIERLTGAIDRLREDMNASVDKIASKQDRNNSVLIGAAVTFGVSAITVAATIWTVFH